MRDYYCGANTNPYDKGIAAGKSSEELIDIKNNPYEQDTPEFKDWVLGFCIGRNTEV